MSVVPFFNKDNPELPDNYSMKILYVNGKTEELELASHIIRDKVTVPIDEVLNKYEVASCPFIEYVTKDDIWGWIPLSSIQRLEFDKNFSKIIAIKTEEDLKKRE